MSLGQIPEKWIEPLSLRTWFEILLNHKSIMYRVIFYILGVAKKIRHVKGIIEHFREIFQSNRT